MNVRALPSPRWATASGISSEVPAASDLSMLRAHFLRCNGCKGRLFSIRCAIDALDGFVATRLVTTLVFVAAIVSVGSLVL